MGFFEGFITEAAKSVDTSLKDSMKRTEDRVEGMAQYRVTRRRAAQENKIKEEKELRDVLGNLASLVDGDMDKAAQLYVDGGRNIKGATSLYNELKKNQSAGIDINAAMTFAQPRAEAGQLEDYVSRFVTPITALDMKDGDIQASGLYGALFNPDLKKSVLDRVDEAAPLDPIEKFKGSVVPGATIDRSGFLAKQAYDEVLAGRSRAAAGESRAVSKEGREQKSFMSAEKRYESAEKRAVDAEARAKKVTASQLDISEAQELRAKADELRNIAEETRKASSYVKEQVLTDLTIEQKQLENKKAKDHPEFATFEKMAVYASMKLTQKGLTPDQKSTFQNMYDDAIDGALAYETATDSTATTPQFSKQSIDSIIDNSIERQLKPVGLVAGVDQKVEDLIKGNEGKYFNNMSMALANVKKRLTNSDGVIQAEASRAIDAENAALSDRIQTFAGRVKDVYAATTGTKPTNYKDLATVDAATEKLMYKTNAQGTFILNAAGEKVPTGVTASQAIREYGKSLKSGDVVTLQDEDGIEFDAVWTGTRYVR